MKFLLLGVAALAQYRPTGQTYGRMDGQQQHRHRDNMFGRFGGHTDVNRRDERYGYNRHVGRYGGYTRQYNQNTNRFAGRRDPFRADPNDSHRGYNPYKRQDRLGNTCKQITAQNYEQECGTYTGRQGCRMTCQKLREQKYGIGNFGRNGHNEHDGAFGHFRQRGYGRFGRRSTGQTQRRQFPSFGRHTTQQRRTSPFGRKTTQRRGFPTFGRRTSTQHRGLNIPTQGGIFGRRSTGRHTFGQHTQTRQRRGFGQNGIFGNRLGREGHNKPTQHRQVRV